MNTVSLVYYKTNNGNWAVDRVYALNHTARSRASKLRNQRGLESFVLKRTVRKAK